MIDLASLGVQVTRSIPVELLPGILSNVYSVHGGVIRNASGQIVSHLASAAGSPLTNLIPGVGTLSSAIANGQLYMVAQDINALQESVSSVLTIASTGAALSGLGLVVSIAGFAYLDSRFDQMKQLIGDLKDLIETRYVADLKSAIANMKHAENASQIGDQNRRDLLLQAHDKFSTLAHLYGDLWAKASNVKELRALEGFYTLAFTGESIANSELGMYDVSLNQYREHLSHWDTTARRQVNELLLSGRPQSLLEVESEKLSTKDFVDLLDFGHATSKGYAWLDEFRRPESAFDRIKALPSRRPWDKPDEQLIELATRWQRRHSVLESQQSHLEFLAMKRVSVGDFSKALTRAANDAEGGAICAMLPLTLEAA